MPACQKCKDKHHVPNDDGQWVPCPDCFAKTRADHRLEGLPSHMRDKSLSSITEPGITEAKVNLTTVITRLAANEFPKRFIILAGASLSKDTLVAATIRDAALAGISADRASFQHCVDTYFTDKSSWRTLLSNKTAILAIQLGSELMNSASCPVLKELILERKWKGAYTFITSDIRLGAMQTGKYPRELVDLLSSPDFKEIPV